MTYEFEGKKEKEAIEKAVAELGLERDQFDVEIIEAQKNTLFKKGYVKIRVHTVSDTEVVSYEKQEKSFRHENVRPRLQCVSDGYSDGMAYHRGLSADLYHLQFVFFRQCRCERPGYSVAGGVQSDGL